MDDCLTREFFMDIASVIFFFSGYGPDNRARIQNIQTTNVTLTECKGFLHKAFFCS